MSPVERNSETFDKKSLFLKMSKITAAIASSIAFALILASGAAAQTNQPTLKLVIPTQGQTLYGNRISILVAVDNFEIVDFAKNPTVAKGQGHVHLWLDDQNPTRESAVKLIKENFTYTDVAFGQHTLRAELVNNNHTSLTQPVVATVNFKSAPVATPSPAPVSGFDKNTALVILVVVALVIVAAWWYTKEEESPKASTAKPKTTKKTARKRRK